MPASSPIKAPPTPRGLCAICQTEIGKTETIERCPDCQAEYHAVCWQENGGCAIYGCSKVPPTENRSGFEVPMSWWGQETKPCPRCGKTIQAAAVRCRTCGATFASARPEDRQEFNDRMSLSNQAAALRTRAIWMFVVCAIPCTAPLGAIAGGIWFAGNRKKLKSLPSLYGALAVIGLGLAIVQTAAFVVVSVLFSVFGGRS